MEQNTIHFSKSDYRTDTGSEHYHINYRNFLICMATVFAVGTLTGLIIAHILYCGTL